MAGLTGKMGGKAGFEKPIVDPRKRPASIIIMIIISIAIMSLSDVIILQAYTE